MFHRSAFAPASFSPDSWRFDGLPAAAPAPDEGGAGGNARAAAAARMARDRLERQNDLLIHLAIALVTRGILR